MRVWRDYQGLDSTGHGAVAAIGNFDGVHCGHRVVIQAAQKVAHKMGAPSGVVTFEPHPRRFFQPDSLPFRLSSLQDKSSILNELGVERLYALTFDAAFASLSAEQFIRDVLIAGLGLKHVAVGEDFVFGKGRGGNVELLRRLGAELDLGLTIVPTQTDGGEIFSSSRIRSLLIDGRPREAAKILGRFWTIDGTVIPGDKRGRTIGFPTANIAMGDHLQPARGVYAVQVGLTEPGISQTLWKPGVANFGQRPTFDKKDVLLEVHIFDHTADLYGQPLRVAFVEYLRPEQKFEGLDGLKRQIVADAAKARAILKKPAQPSFAS